MIKYLMILAMVLFADNAIAQTLTASTVEIEPGGETDLVVSYESKQDLTAVQFAIALPEGISIKKKGKRYIAALGEEIEDDYEFKIKDSEAGKTVLITRVDNTCPALTSGIDLITFTLVAEETVTLGEMQATISAITFSDKGTSVKGNDDFNVTINVFARSKAVIVVGGEASIVDIEPGNEADLTVNYESEENLTAAQFTITLPEGISIKKEGKRYVAILSEEIEDNYEFKIIDDDDGKTVLITRLDNTSPALPSGIELITLTLIADKDATLGKKQAKISAITFSRNGESVRGNEDFNVTINVFTKSEAIIVVGGEANITGTFGQELAAPTVTVTEGYDGVLSYKSSNEKVVKVATDGQLTVVGTGEAVITISGTETAYWKAPANVTYIVQIDKATIMPGITLEGWTFGQAANTPVVTGNTGNGTISYQYKAKEADDNTYSAQVPVNSGNYTVKAVVEATANYKGGEATADFTIARKSVTVVMIEDIADQSYTGSALTPEITVKDGNTTMVLNTDYTVAYTDNTEIGRATVTITGQGNYKDSASKTFFIIVKGDANGDGDVDVSDIDTIIEAVGGEYDETADVNGDGDVDVSDIDYVIERIQ